MVSITLAMAQVSINEGSVTVGIGEKANVSCTYSGKSSDLSWASTDSSIATVTGNGKSAVVTGVSEGYAYITVEVKSNWGGGDNVAYVLVTVTGKEVTLTDADLSFVPTTRTAGSLAKDTHWYTLTLRGKHVYLQDGAMYCTSDYPYYTGEEPLTQYLWAITGNCEKGFQFYNYDEPTKHMGVVAGESEYGYTKLEGTQACAYADGEADESACTFRISANADGYTFTLIDETYAGLNDYNSSGSVCIWDNYRNLTDGGACFRFYEVDPVELGGIPAEGVVNETKVTLNVTTLSLNVGDTYTLVPTISPDNATFKQVTWSSSNSNLASVSTTGTITARASGKVTITATTRNGLTATVEVTISSNTNAQGLVINEIQASNVDQYLDPSYNYGGWIELYNTTASEIKLSGLFLTDNLDNMTQWPLSSLNLTYANYQKGSTRYIPHSTTSAAVPAKGYSLVWFDHNDWRYPMMCPFKLDCDGGNIYITDGGSVITEASYPESINRSSWARTTDGGSTWSWTAEPTLGTSNNKATYASERLAAPVVDTDSKVFANGSFTVRVTYPAGSTLRYTTDGSTPTAQHGNTSTNGVFNVSETQILRLCAVQNGKLTSPVVTRSYIKPKSTMTLPVLSIVTEQGNLTDSKYGIMVTGTNGRPGLGRSSTSNMTQDWDRPANAEFIINENEMVFNQETNIAICGGWSRFNTPHSFKIKGKKQLEHMNYLPYSFFTAKPYIKNKTLQMRNGGNHTNNGRIEDAAIQTVILSSGLNIDGQSYEPVHVFENGDYTGILNMREPNNRDLVYANFGYDDDEVDQFEMDCDSGYVQSCGDRDAFELWYDLSSRLKSEPDVYEQIKQICDVEEFINYMAVQSFLALQDYGYNNVKGYRPRVDHGKFRFVLYDLDSFSSSISSSKFSWEPTSYRHNSQYEGTNGAKGASAAGIEVEYQTIFNNMLTGSDEFRKQFVDQFSILCGSVLEPERCHHIVDSLCNNIRDAASIEGFYPDGACSQINSNVFNSTRLSNALAAMAGNSRYSSACKGNNQNLVLSQNIGGGRLLYNDLPIPTGKFSGRIFSPVTLRAEAPAGYKFLGWKNLSGSGYNPYPDPDEKEETLFDYGNKWYYYDQGSLDEEDWTAKTYTADLSWEEGTAPLGYNRTNKGLGTIISYGNDSSNKYITYYFRKYVNLSEIPASLTLNYNVDDGFAVYVNGQEAGRYNLPQGAKYGDLALSYPSTDYYTGTISIPTTLLTKGQNTIAVEVHNNVASSTDIYWDASVTYVPKGETNPDPDPEQEKDFISTDAEFTLPTSGSYQLQAVYGLLDEKDTESEDVHPVKVNEVSAANSIYVNDYYKKDDWVELYNTTDKDIDLTGYFLSDNLAKPTKYQIPESSVKDGNILPAHGHRVIWCSKRDRIGKEIHASFKLDNAEGACVILTSPDQKWSDTFAYQVMNGDETCGLYPDGASNGYLMQLPTIQKSNMLTMYADWYDEHELEIESGNTVHVEKLVSHSNQLGITYVGESLLVTNEDFLPTSLKVYTLDGHAVLSSELNMSEGRSYVNVAHLPVGTYVATATDTEGVKVSVKFSVR